MATLYVIPCSFPDACDDCTDLGDTAIKNLYYSAELRHYLCADHMVQAAAEMGREIYVEYATEDEIEKAAQELGVITNFSDEEEYEGEEE